MKRQRGVALILAIGVLAVLTTFATTFALNMRLEYKVAVNYYNAVRARYIADAALQKAIAELRGYVKTNAFDSLASSSSTVTTLEGEAHSANAVIEDEQGKLNINNCDADLFENLIEVLVTKKSYQGLSTDDASTIIELRPDSGYSTLQDIIVRAQIDKEKIALLKPYITTLSYEDPNNSNRSPINVNTADRALIAAVLITDSDLDMDPAWNVAGGLEGAGLTSWNEFNNTIDGMIQSGYINEEQATNIKENVNPNRATVTTKFCFHPGGYYSITATGTVYDGASNTLAEEVLSSVVKINEIYTETTKEQFEGGTTNRTTYLNSVPDEREDGIKLGFWDNFDETLSDGTLFSIGKWGGLTDSDDIYNGDGDVDNELVAGSYQLFIAPRNWDDFYFSVKVTDLSDGYQMKDVAQVIFRGDTLIGDPDAAFARQGPLEWGGAWAYMLGGEIVFLTNSEATALGLDPSQDKYIYPSQLRIWPDSNQDTDSERTLIDYEVSKTLEITAHDSGATISVGNTFFTRNDVVDRSGRIALYPHAISVAWDDVRIIGSSGSFRSADISPGETVEWGTITGTIEDPEEGNIEIRANGTGTLVNLSSTNPFAVIGGSSSSIYWEAIFTQFEEDTSHTGCPVLEDVTITYLPETVVKYYTIFQ